MKLLKTMLLAAFAASFFFVLSSFANTDNRNWTLASGEKLTGILESYDPGKDIIVLKVGEDGETREYKLNDFSTIDRAWLTEWDQVAGELEVVMKSSEGRFEHYQSKGQYITDFYVYYPGIITKDSNRPMFMMFHPSGKGARYNQEFIQAAEIAGVIIVTFDTFRNTEDEKMADELHARFTELLPRIEHMVPHDPGRMFLGGVSGGAMLAYMYSADVKRPWAGVYSNGGWLGGKQEIYNKPFPAGMRIAMVNGNNDEAANAWVDNDMAVLKGKGCNVRVFSYEGTHQDAPPMAQLKAFLWLITGQE